jgi:hypothetical protein
LRERLRKDYFKVENEEDGTRTAIDRKTPDTLQKLNSSANQVKTGRARMTGARKNARDAATSRYPARRAERTQRRPHGRAMQVCARRSPARRARAEISPRRISPVKVLRVEILRVEFLCANFPPAVASASLFSSEIFASKNFRRGDTNFVSGR